MGGCLAAALAFVEATDFTKKSSPNTSAKNSIGLAVCGSGVVGSILIHVLQIAEHLQLSASQAALKPAHKAIKTFPNYRLTALNVKQCSQVAGTFIFGYAKKHFKDNYDKRYVI